MALTATAAGLSVAIPVYFISMYFEARVDHERSYMEAAIAKVLFSIAPISKEDARPLANFAFGLPRATVPGSLGG